MYNTEDFIKRAMLLYGDRYDYSSTVYKGIKNKLKIICRLHGEFYQTADGHVQGREGCKECSSLKRKHNDLEGRKNSFIEKAKICHEYKYDYSKIEYSNNSTPVIIICPIHGEFEQIPSVHLSGSGCRICGIIKCSDSLRMTKEDFIKRAKEAHGDYYEYPEDSEYGATRDVRIICKKHGPFVQNGFVHLKGHGCSKCARERNSGERARLTGAMGHLYYETSNTSFLYLLSMDELFLKVGVSKNPINRSRTLKRESGCASVRNVISIAGNANKIYEFEQYLLKDSGLRRTVPKLQFAGKYECFHISEKGRLVTMIRDYYTEHFSDVKLDPKHVFKDYQSIPKYIRERAQECLASYIEEILIDDLTRAAWDRDEILMEEVRVEINDILKQFILDAAMDWY